MFFDQVHVISKHIKPAPLTDVEKLETELGVKMPSGYAPFITRFGEGAYCDLFQIFAPKHILADYKKYREGWDSFYYRDTEEKPHWFFEGSEHILSEAQVQDSIIVGTSIDGDNLLFYPPQPDKIFILPRHSQKIVWVNADLSDLHAWDSREPRVLTFAPYNQAILTYLSTDFSLTQESCLAQFRARWGDDALMMIHEKSDAWSWQNVFFLPPIGGRVQIVQDEGVTRTFTQENRINATIRGNGQRTLDIRIDCDKEAEAEVEAFIAHLETQGVAKF